MITYHSRVAVLNARGDHIRYVHSAMATAMVSGGTASQPDPTIGRVRAITLSRTAEVHAHRTGAPTASPFGGVRFFRQVRLDESACRIFEHHPRCTYE